VRRLVFLCPSFYQTPDFNEQTFYIPPPTHYETMYEKIGRLIKRRAKKHKAAHLCLV